MTNKKKRTKRETSHFLGKKKQNRRSTDILTTQFPSRISEAAKAITRNPSKLVADQDSIECMQKTVFNANTNSKFQCGP